MQRLPLFTHSLSRRYFSAQSKKLSSTDNILHNRQNLFRKRAKWAVCLFVGSLIGGAGIYAYQNQGFRRSAYFWYHAFPIYAHYRFTEWQYEKKSDEEYDKALNLLHDRYCDQAFAIVLKLGGFYVKLGQLGSTRDEFVPPQYLRLIKTLQSNVSTCQPIEYVKRLVENELGRPFDEVFEWIDPTALGAASIGQCHRARIRAGVCVEEFEKCGKSRDIVIKVQYPNVEKQFLWDIKTIEDFCWLAQPAHLPFINETRKQFMTEFDYSKEADNLTTVSNNILPEWGDKVSIPYPIKSFCTKRLLVMEYLKGVDLIKGIEQYYTELAEERGTTLEALKEEQRQKELTGIANGEPTEAQIRKYQQLLNISARLSNFLRVIYNYTLGWVLPNLAYSKPKKLLNIPGILSLLWEVHGYELIINGAFNGDPHPGNILLLDNGKIGLIDYGQVKHITLEERLRLAKLLVALCKEDIPEVLRIQRDEIKLHTKKQSDYAIEKWTRISWDIDSREVTEGLNIQLFLEHLDAVDPIINTPEEYILAVRMVMVLRGLGTALKYPIHACREWENLAASLLKKHGVKYTDRGLNLVSEEKQQ